MNNTRLIAAVVLAGGALAAYEGAVAQTSSALLRVRCDGDSVGAEVSINGQFKGECPFDTKVPAGPLRIEARKPAGHDREWFYGQQVRVGADTVKAIDIVLDGPQLTAEGQRAEDARIAAAKLAEEERIAAADAARRTGQQAALELRQRADAGDLPAVLQLAQAYRTGSGGYGVNLDQALAWDLKAAQAGDGEAMVRVAQAYEDGKGVAQHFAEAMKWYRRAADKGVPAGMGGVAGFLVGGRVGVPQNQAQARMWAERGLVLDDPRSMTVMAILTDSHDPQEALRLRYKAAGKGDRRAMFQLGLCNAGEVKCGFPIDWVDALKWFRQAWDKGMVEAASYIGTAYRQGLGGLQKDPHAAARIYLEGMEAGDVDSKIGYAVMHATRELGADSNSAEGVRLLKQVADAGNADAMNDLGVIYWRGNGVERNKQAARAWWRKAAGLGHARAAHNLKLAD